MLNIFEHAQNSIATPVRNLSHNFTADTDGWPGQTMKSGI
jgi:hypothetical protein